MYRSYALGQYRTMYDNPIYRWRASIAVALSEMHKPPTHGYVAYRSISDYLNLHGLGLLDGEASPLPTAEELHTLIYDPTRLEDLIRAAAATPVDPALPSVPIVGNEKGEADFYFWSFSLFGIHLASLWKFYFVLLFFSTTIFFLTYFRSQLCLLLLLVYLVGHYALVGLASAPWVQTVHNSRFFPVLALLPALHLLLLLLTRMRFSRLNAACALAQTVLLFFLVFCRFQAIWQPVAIIVVGVLMAPWHSIWTAFRQQRRLSEPLARTIVAVWPAAFVAAGLAGLILYQNFALNHDAYKTETKTHTFWEPMFSGTVGADPELCKLYCGGEEPYSDNLGYVAVLNYLRHYDNAKPDIAYVFDGQIQIDAMKDMGVYDNLLRHIFFDMLKQHPLLVLRSMFFEKLDDQVDILYHARILHYTGNSITGLLAVAIGFLILTTGFPSFQRTHVAAAARCGAILAVFSLTTTEIIPDVLIFDTVMFFTMVAVLLIALTVIFASRVVILGAKDRLMRGSPDRSINRLSSQ